MKKAVIKGICAVILGATLGSADAARWLGNRYLFGDSGFEANVAQGLEYYRKAVEMGDSTAAYRLGELYFYGDGAASVPGLPVGWKSGLAKDEAKAVELYRKAAEQDGARESDAAAYRLGLCYLNGTGVEKDEAKAREWLRKAELGGARLTLAERFGADEPFCAFIEAARWLEPEKKVENNQKFFEAVQRAAENGNASAEEWLAYQYLNGSVGYDVAKDPAKGAELGSRFAEATKDAQWAINVARFYLYLNDGGDAARGIELLTKAVEWSQKALERRVGTQALLEKGIIYETYGLIDAALLLSRATEAAGDLALSVEWTRRAADVATVEKRSSQALSDAARRLGARSLDGDGVERNEAEGLKWFAFADSNVAWLELAERYETGRGVEKSVEKAAEAREKAKNATRTVKIAK